MTQDSSSSPAQEQILAEAMDWLMRLRDNPADTGLHARHQQWLNEQDAHARAWQQAQHTWQLLQQLPPASAIPPPARATTLPVRQKRTAPRRLVALAVAACLMLALLPTLSLHWRASHMTDTGITKLISLPDGSTVHLGADSAISTDFNHPQRQVTLLRGEAFFDVTPDPQRPFVVKTDTLEITVLGTSFNVSIGKLTETVGVASGKVQVEDRRHGRLAGYLTPGEQLSLYHDGRLQRTPLAVADIGAWRDNRLFVQNAAIADVAATLQRYQTGHTLLVSRALAEQRVTGAYDLTTPDSALHSLIAPYQGNVLKLPLLRVITP